MDKDSTLHGAIEAGFFSLRIDPVDVAIEELKLGNNYWPIVPKLGQ
jgi:hypothetical protein